MHIIILHNVLTAVSEEGISYAFAYDGYGLRTQRTNGTTAYNYIYNGSQLVQMTVGGNTLRFTYDALGMPLTVTYNGTTYYYSTNVQGDIIAILDASGNSVVQYVYDAWGNVRSTAGSLASTLGAHNPLRYRGYVYDNETALYYLQSRYYNPETGRFLNADAMPSTGQGLAGNNMFAYCGNNPVSREDDGGLFWDTVFDVVSLVFSVIDVINHPDDPMAWLGVAADVASLLIPFATGGGAIVKAATKADDVFDAAKTLDTVADAADDLHDFSKAVPSVHGNSLDYPGTNYGYVLSDMTTGEVVKYGESIKPAGRYTEKYINGANPIGSPLEMTVVISGTKREIHTWQHMQILEHLNTVGELPKLNKSLW